MWTRKGIIFQPDGNSSWMQSHAYLPTALALHDRIRVFVSFWDANKIGRIGYVDVEIDDPTKVIDYSREPALDTGNRGEFDEHGVSPLSVIYDTNGQLRLYYAGWQRDEKVRYYLFTGLATSDDNGLSFTRFSKTPVIDRTDEFWQVRTGGCTLFFDNAWHTWYAEFSGQTRDRQGKLIPTYNWSYMRSDDGIHWPDKGQVCLKSLPGEIHGYGRASILHKNDDGFQAWLSVRTVAHGYRIGYTQSMDGLHWSQIDFNEKGLLPRQTGFDSEETSFASIINHPAKESNLIMFYNGREYGKDGLAVALGKFLQ